MTGLLKALSKSQAPEILLFLDQRGRVRHTELKKLAPASTLYLRLQELKKLGLLRIEREAEVPPQAFYSLTQEGKRIARLLKQF